MFCMCVYVQKRTRKYIILNEGEWESFVKHLPFCCRHRYFTIAVTVVVLVSWISRISISHVIFTFSSDHAFYHERTGKLLRTRKTVRQIRFVDVFLQSHSHRSHFCVSSIFFSFSFHTNSFLSMSFSCWRFQFCRFFSVSFDFLLFIAIINDSVWF